MRAGADLLAEVAHLILHRAQRRAHARGLVGQGAPGGDALLQLGRQGRRWRIERGRPGGDVVPSALFPHGEPRQRRIPQRVVPLVHELALAVPGSTPLKRAPVRTQARLGRTTFGAGQRRRGGREQHACATLQDRIAPAEEELIVVQALQDGIVALDGVADADDVAGTHVLQHQQRGHAAGGHVVLEGRFASCQGDRRGVELALPHAIAAHLHPVQGESLVVRHELDLVLGRFGDQRFVHRLICLVMEHGADRAAPVDLRVDQPVAPARALRAGGGGVPGGGDAGLLHPGRRRSDRKTVLAALVDFSRCFRVQRQRETAHQQQQRSDTPAPSRCRPARTGCSGGEIAERERHPWSCHRACVA